MKFILYTYLFFFSVLLYAQSDTLPYIMYRDRVVLHTSLSYRGAPFNIKDDFNGLSQLNYEGNLNIIQGVGVAYKWFALSLHYKLPSYLKDVEKYGKTNYFDLGFQFSLKKWFFRADYHRYKGFAIKNARKINDSIPVTDAGYYLNNGLVTSSIGINAYHFFNPTLNMKAAIGRAGRYTEQAHGFYLRFTADAFRCYNERGIIPFQYLDSVSSIRKATSMGAIDAGVVPGYAYLNNIDGWQFGAFLGIGAMIQAKVYQFEEKNRSFLGLIPRVDLRLQTGYNVENWFLMFTASFDQKNLQFTDYKYNQFYYNVGITYGYRFQ